MRIQKFGVSLFAIAGLTALALAGCSDQGGGDPRTAPASKDWPMIEGNWGNQRFSSLDKINTTNVKTLGGAWAHKFEGATTRATPVVSNGVMYVTAGSHVYALNPKTGEKIWDYKPSIAPTGLYKGVTLGEGMVFVGLSDAGVIALKETTGELVWATNIGDVEAEESVVKAQSPTGQFVSTAPAYANGIVVVPMVNGDYGVRGRLVGLDAKTGQQLWRWDATPGPSDPGHSTWPSDNDEWTKGGGGIWTTPAVDTELGLVYIGTGNPVPQWGGEARAGDNLYTVSAVAIDLKTGERKWHFQLVHHDIWESDLGTPFVFYDATVEGKTRKAIAVMRTDGYLFMFDRATGEALHPVEERPVPQNERVKTAATQPFPVGADQLGPNCVKPENIPAGFKALCHYDPVDYDTPNGMYPINTTRAARMAYSPITKHFYVSGSPAWPFWIRRFEDPKFFSAMGTSVPGIKTSGVIAAIDSTTNKIVWEKPMPYEIQNGSGMMATAGGLLFHGEPDGTVQAYDAKTGETLWTFQTGAYASGAVMTYEVDGEQYVALTNTHTLWSFKLGGTVAPLPAPEPPATVTTWGGRIVATDEIILSPVVQDTGLGKMREAIDEFAVKPTRAKASVGEKVTWTNTGKETHTMGAQDGSWTTGPVAPGKSVSITFDKPGVYTYICKEHPWSYAEITIEE
jgi:quinohemoprotein ethanol dehydrogenase